MGPMMKGLMGRKLGMTQVFDEQGRQVPVTVLEVGPCVVVQRKTAKADGYEAVQIGFEEVPERKLSQPLRGHFKKQGVSARRVLREVRLEEGEDPRVGEVLTVSIFEGTTHVDVTGVTKGRGFQGVVKRHRMAGGDASHGAMSHRRIGAVGQRQTPGRVFKNKRLPGHMGHENVTVQNLRVVQVRPEDHVVLVEGSVPGPIGGLLYVRKALKKAAKTS